MYRRIFWILLLPITIFILTIFLFVERVKGIPIEDSLDNLVYDAYSVCATRSME